jgi:hypothetical protein
MRECVKVVVAKRVELNECCRHVILACILSSMAALCPQLLAQQTGPLSAPPTNSAATPVTAPSTQPSADPKVPADDRIFWTLPNYLTVENSSTMPPLTPGAKIMLIARDTWDPFTFCFIGLEAGVNQASNSNPSLGQGFKGYAKRYGLAFADNGIGNFLTSGVFPIVLRQDPRFYEMGRGRFLHRAWYAGTRVLVTRSDAGATQINYSEFLGNIVAAGISNVYHPGPRTIRSNLNIFATQVAWDAVSYELKEFWPDIHRLTSHHH